MRDTFRAYQQEVQRDNSRAQEMLDYVERNRECFGDSELQWQGIPADELPTLPPDGA